MGLPPEDLPPAFVRDYQQIQVELDSLRGIASGMRQELDTNFRTHVTRVYDAMTPGASLGDSIVGAEMWELRSKYHQCITRTIELLAAHDTGTYSMAEGAAKVADNYGNSDTWAAGSAKRVESVMGAPPPAPQPANPAPNGGTQ